MSWDFETDPEFQKELDWIDLFVKEEVEPLDHVLGFPYEVKNPKRNALVRPLQAEVKKRGLWACHLGPELGANLVDGRLGVFDDVMQQRCRECRIDGGIGQRETGGVFGNPGILDRVEQH